ncbi:hypothetical protein DRN86_02825 [Candidatus Geothermarchaeota archaeon]|nr:MAG: hypothetical protein DRN86_02825 [Candidatus Geothermarchaeota archaeon]
MSFILKAIVSLLASYFMSRLIFLAINGVNELVAKLISGWVFLISLPAIFLALNNRNDGILRVLKVSSALYWLMLIVLLSSIYPYLAPVFALAMILTILHYIGVLTAVFEALKWRIEQIIQHILGS